MRRLMNTVASDCSAHIDPLMTVPRLSVGSWASKVAAAGDDALVGDLSFAPSPMIPVVSASRALENPTRAAVLVCHVNPITDSLLISSFFVFSSVRRLFEDEPVGSAKKKKRKLLVLDSKRRGKKRGRGNDGVFLVWIPTLPIRLLRCSGLC